MNNYRGALWGISIIGFDGEMSDVHSAFDVAGIDYLAEESTEIQVFVNPSHLGQAVKIINDLGYETDEDEDKE